MSADTILRDTAVLVEVKHLTGELLAASQSYRRAKARSERITGRYGRGAECDWHGTELVRLGTALLALAAVARDGVS